MNAIGPTIPTQGQFERDVMYLQQIRGDLKSKVGDRGVLDKFSITPVKLYFMTSEVKASIIENPENPSKWPTSLMFNWIPWKVSQR